MAPLNQLQPIRLRIDVNIIIPIRVDPEIPTVAVESAKEMIYAKLLETVHEIEMRLADLSG